ncbi:MAG TPA: tRNA-uridine aminocarboxypropyltransferase [Anaeromyxobacteraceae bacterium]|nr:tRNA-uridine aminocarboxypropyltransferase [Anaeromyxobacteraceae bacterium]
MRCRIPDLSRRCPRCLFPPDSCLCPEIPRLETATRVLFVRHAAERTRTTNTGRWAALALLRSELLEHAVPGAPLDSSRISAGRAAVLFPSPAGEFVPSPRPETLVVVDGTWAQARRMLQRIPELRSLPRLSLAARPGDRLRRPTVSGGMSTLEAVAAALDLLGEGAAAQALAEVHRRAVSRARSLRCLDASAA